jgi:sugar phosphate permease
MSFANQALLYFFISWLPSLFAFHGYPVSQSIRASGIFSAGAVIGGLLIAKLIQATSATTILTVTYIIAGVSVCMLGVFKSVDMVFYAVVCVAGACITGSQFCLSATIGQFYPSPVRSTGLGFANGAGRIGAIVAPLLGSVLITWAASLRETFLYASSLAGIAAIATAGLWLSQRRVR